MEVSKKLSKKTVKDQVAEAAPDMLVALRMLLSSTSNREGIAAVEMAKRAILKAEGKMINTES